MDPIDKLPETTPSAPPPPLNSSIVTSTSHFVTLKLTINNYLLWRAQIIPFLKGHQLYGYVDGFILMPSPTLVDQPNLEYTC